MTLTVLPSASGSTPSARSRIIQGFHASTAGALAPGTGIDLEVSERSEPQSV